MQAIERTFAVLRALAAHPERAGVSEIARRAGLPKSTTSRILGSLESLGMVERIGDRFGIGAGLATLSHAQSPVGSLRELARPHLVELSEQLGENASLVVDDGDEVLYIDTATPPDDVQVQVQDWTGERLPFHAAAAGQALMAYWPDVRLRDYAAAQPVAFTDATVTTLTGLRRKAAEVRDTGVVWTLQEFADDVNGVGAPIPGPDGRPVGALNVYGPTYRFPATTDLDGAASALREACAAIGAHLAQP